MGVNIRVIRAAFEEVTCLMPKIEVDLKKNDETAVRTDVSLLVEKVARLQRLVEPNIRSGRR